MALAVSASAQWSTLHYQAFEDSVSPWTHSNGQAFPFGWGRQASTLHPGWAPPDPGGWCLWIDSDAAGMAGTDDTAFSPAVPGDSCDPVKIRWGIGYDDYYSGADFMRMLYRTRTGGIWQAWSVGKSYTDDAVIADSIILSGIVDSLQVAFYYSDGGAWAGWAALDNVEVSGIPVGVAGGPTAALDGRGLEMEPPRPNPFGRVTNISYQTSKPGRVGLKVYNAAGQCVRNLVSVIQSPGNHTVRWDGRDERGAAVSSGVYLYRLEAGGEAAMGRMAVVR